MRTLLLGALLGLSTMGCDAGPGPGGPPMCTGAGCGSCEATGCVCNGTERCDARCADDCTLTCSGTEGCAGECGDRCRFTCSGTDECDVAVGAGSTVVCSGTHGCDVDCVGGGCTVTCSGTDGCLVGCPEGMCAIDCEGRAVEDCGDGISACARACP